MSVEEKVRSILLDILDISEADLTPDAALRTHLGASSVDLVEVVAALENEFDLDVSDEEAQTMSSLADIVKYIEDKTSS